MQVDWMSFVAHSKSAKFVAEAQRKEMAEWLLGPSFSLDICGMKSLPKGHDAPYISGIELDNSFQDWNAVPNEMTVFGRIYIRPGMTREDWKGEFESFVCSVDYYIIDLCTNNTSLSELVIDKPNLIAEVELNSTSDILTLLADTDLLGLSIPGGEETEVGLRSFEDVQDIMEALEIEV